MNTEKIQLQISVIIPVYNCEEYIEQCIKSVQAQTCTELEIICIDDGSTDNSVRIIKDMQINDKRIVLFRQNNQGAGLARNIGIQNANGRFLAFLDADDYYYDNKALEKMIQMCDTKSVQICGCITCKKLIDYKLVDHNLFDKLPYVVIEGGVYSYWDYQIDYSYTNFIFLRKLLVDNKILFPNYRRFQDPPFMVRAMYAAVKFTVVDSVLYCIRVPLILNRYNNLKTRDLLRGIMDVLQFSNEKGLNVLFQNTINDLEYKYIDTIFHNVSEDDVELIELLLDINKIVCNGLNDSHYIIRPLKRILRSISCDNVTYERELLELIKVQNEIALYGAGRYTRLFIEFLKQNKLINKVSFILVSNLENNPENLEGIRVQSVTDLALNLNDMPYVLVTLGSIYHKEVEDILNKNHISRFMLMDDLFMASLEQKVH